MPVRDPIRPGWATPAAIAVVAMLAACTSSTSGSPLSLGVPSGSRPAGVPSASTANSAPVESTAASTAPKGKATSKANTGAGAPGCPTAAQVGALAGTTFPNPQTNSSAGSAVCSYNNTSTGVNVVIVISPATPGLSPAELKTVVAAEAKSQKVVNVHEVSGIGDAAWEFTEPDAGSEINHTATTFLEVLTSTSTIAVTGPVKGSVIEAIARLVLSH